MHVLGPADAKKCPGWTPVSCGVVPDGNRPYWTHHCLPGTFPAPDKNLKLACKPHKGPDGFFQCYITQVRPLTGRHISAKQQGRVNSL